LLGVSPVGSKHNSNPRTKKNMDDRKRTHLCMTIIKMLETHDTTSTAKFDLMEKKTALKIRHLVEAMDEE
jgi:hypothetical protein